MQFVSLKSVLAAVWISAVLIAGLAAHVNSLSNWAVLAVAALLPPVFIMWRLNTPVQTMSERINEARR
jgi:Flp pilus assembly protein TadB